jgi:hypothetical protein
VHRRLIAALALVGCGAKVIDHGQSGGDSGFGTGGTSGAQVDGAMSDAGPQGEFNQDCRFPTWPADQPIDPLCDRTDDTDGIAQLGGCNACLCESYCVEHDDCGPIPTTGTAVPECLQPDGICVLRCDAGQQCPDGMQCVSGEPFPVPMCAWSANDPLMCFAREGGEDPCAAYRTIDECLAVQSPNAAVRCDWVERRVLATDSDGCESALVEDVCMAVTSEYECSPSAQCPGGGGLFWTDLGAGTAEIITVSDCAWRPIGAGGSPCDFTGDIPIPLVCGCGCGAGDPTGGTAAEGGDCPCEGA